MREIIKKAESRREAQKSNQPEAMIAWARGGRVGANFGMRISDFEIKPSKSLHQHCSPQKFGGLTATL